MNWAHAPNPATLSLDYNSAMAALLDFTKLKSGDVVASLGGVSDLLGLANGGSLLSQKLPLLDESLVQILNLANTVSGRVGGVSLGANSTVQQVGQAIASAFSLPSGSVSVTMSGHLLRITFDVAVSASGSQALQVDLDKLVADLPDGNQPRSSCKGYPSWRPGPAGASTIWPVRLCTLRRAWT